MQPQFQLPIIPFQRDASEWSLPPWRWRDWLSVEHWLEQIALEGAQVQAYDDRIELSLTPAYGPLSIQAALGEEVLFLDNCPSTQRLAAEHVNQYGIVVAEQQSAGRGRLGRQWVSESKLNILLSMIIRPQAPVSQWPRGPLRWSAAIANRLGLHVKWPNDIVTAEGNKVGGILSTLEHDTKHNPFLIFGLGLNVNQVHFEALPEASSLAVVYNQPFSRLAILHDLVQTVKSTGVDGPLELWRQRCRMLGRPVRAAGYEGIAEDIREDGALIVSGKVILSGDVEILEVK